MKIYTDENLGEFIAFEPWTQLKNPHFPEGYEKEAWERTQQYNEAERIRKLREAKIELAERAVQGQALAARDSGLGEGLPGGDSDEDEIQVTAVINFRTAAVSTGADAQATIAADGNNNEDTEDTSTILTLTLRGKEGDVKAKAKSTTKMASLVAYYRKQKKVEVKMSIELDGEILEGDSTVADADLDDGDMLSVVLVR